MSRRGRSSSWRPTSASTASASGAEVVISTATARTSCSAWAMRSLATSAASAVASARTRISLGPAIMSMSTLPKTSRLAAVTNALPGPQILSTAAIDSVP